MPMNKDSMSRAETILVQALQSLREGRRLIVSYPRITGRQEYLKHMQSYTKLSEELINDMGTTAKKAYICGPSIAEMSDAMKYAVSVGLGVMANHDATLRERVKCLAGADMVILTEGWEDSRETRIEAKLAFDLGIEIIQLNILKIIMGDK